MNINDIKSNLANQRYDEALMMSISYSNFLSTTQNSDEVIQLSKVMSDFPDDVSFKTPLIIKKLAIMSGYTSQFIAHAIRALSLRYHIWFEIYETGYGLFHQAAMGQDSDLNQFKPDLCFFLIGNEHLIGKSPHEDLQNLENLWTETHHQFKCDIIQNTFEIPILRSAGNLDAKINSRYRHILSLNDLMGDRAPPFVHFNDVHYISAMHGMLSWKDEKLYDYSKMPVSFEKLIPYANNVCAVVSGILGKSKKCLMLDLDNTLWGGVVGDDGVDGIEIGEGSAEGEAFKRFQLFIKEQKDRGVILAVCSKNDEQNAKEPFIKREEMILKLDDISCFIANWETKPQNIATIAKRLNIGLDSILFIDDNPAEREIVRQQLPEVMVLDLPDDSSQYARCLSLSSWLDVIKITSEDLERTNFYKANETRELLSNQTGDYNKYLESLEMVATIEPFDSINMPRIVQLINKTNQFNLTTKRYTDTEVTQFADDAGAVTAYIKVKDRFGDNGLISVFIGFRKNDELLIDTWLMSCRVLKRRVEELLFQYILKWAASNKINIIRGKRIPTEKNKLVENLLADLGFTPANQDRDGEWIYSLKDNPELAEELSKKLPFQITSPIISK